MFRAGNTGMGRGKKRSSPAALDLQLFAGEKTEEATPKRRREVRERGQTAKTAELGAGLILLSLFLAVPFVGKASLYRARTLLETCLGGQLLSSGFTQDSVHMAMVHLIMAAAEIVAPFILIAAVMGLVGQLVQTGFMFTLQPLKLDLKRISPLEGFKRVISRRALIELLKATGKICVVVGIVYAHVKGKLLVFPQLVIINPVEAAAIIGESAQAIGLKVGAAMTVLACLDYIYQRWEFEQGIKMSRQELKDELKDTEGDPAIRAKVREQQRQLANRRMMQQVPDADVVITNPVHLAVALKYSAAEMRAPVVVAKGQGYVAGRIKEIARQYEVPIVRNVGLARTLFAAVDIDEEIPPDLYQAVAEVLAMVYRLDH